MLPKHGLKTILCAASIIITAACFFVVLSRARPKPAPPLNPSPGDMIMEYWALSERGEVEEAEKYLPETNSDGKFVADLSYLHLESEAEGIYKSKLHLIRIISEAEKGDRAQVEAEVINSFGGVTQVHHMLHKENGRWKLFGAYTVNPSLCEHLPHMCNFVDY